MDTSAKALQEAISIRRQIDVLEKRLSSILGTPAPSSPTRKGRRRMSSATRAKLAAAARARWARQKARMKTTAAKKKGGITAAGRKRLSQLMKARWAVRLAGPGTGH
jgi:hypothetical protein